MRPARASDADTIIAPATPLGRSALAVVRLSGPRVRQIARELDPTFPQLPPDRTARLCRLRDAAGGTLDRAVVTFFKAPRSFTGEDTIEISLHGNPILVQMIMDRATAAGARPARPGEFSRRAFLNGKLDLMAAEAVGELIEAGTEAEIRGAVARQAGELREEIDQVRRQLEDVATLWTGAIDFPSEAGDEDREEVGRRIGAARKILTELAARSRAGAARRRGWRVVIAGAPNAGKSTIFNRLVGSERAIVSPVPGTTRDTIEEEIDVGGIRVRLIDTAGLRDDPDAIEAEGITRARASVAGADLIVLVVDLSREESPAERGFRMGLPADATLLLANKQDRAAIRPPDGAIPVCAIGTDAATRLSELLAAAVAARVPPQEGTPIVSLRQAALLERARGLVESVETGHAASRPAEYLFADLDDALGTLSELSGETTSDEMLDRLFSTFCIGK